MINSLSNSNSAIATSILRNDISSHDIANINTSEFSESSPIQSELKTGGTEVSAINKLDTYEGADSNTDLATEMVEQNVNKDTLKANTAVMRVQNEMVGTLLDLKG